MPYSTTVALQHWTVLEDVDRLLARCLDDLGGMARFVKPGQTVLIKPNITANAPSDTGGTTHLELVEALIRLVQACQPGRIIVAEGTGAFGAEHETAFPTGGWREMFARCSSNARTGVEMYNLDKGPHKEFSLDKPHYPYPLPFSQLVLDADVFITVPCLKTHINCDYTVALKNAFGQTPQWKRSEIHAQGLLEEALTDLNRIRKPDLSVVDGWEGSEGIAGGASFERPAGAHVLLVGADPVAVDVVSRELMCRTLPTRYLKWAAEDGVGEGDMARIQVLGAPLEECRHAFMFPADEICQLVPGLTFHDQGACSGCRSAAVLALSRLRWQKPKKDVSVLYGGQGEPDCVLDGNTLFVGKCARAFAARYPGVGTVVGDCPAKVDDILHALDTMDVTCHQCRDLVNKALAELPDEAKTYLRVTASGSQVFAGPQVRRDAWHRELLVGNCMARFARMVRERAPQFGLDPARDIIWLEGCPPEESAVRDALARLQGVRVPEGAKE